MKSRVPGNTVVPAQGLASLLVRLRALGNPADAGMLARFFKTGQGEYGEGDVFIGVRVPEVRRLARDADAVPVRDLAALLESPVHEERMLALVCLIRRFQRGGAAEREAVFHAYLARRHRVNNWDLVDISAPHIPGAWLLDRPRGLLDELAGSPSLWDRRIAVVSTFAMIRAGQFGDTLRLCTGLLGDRHDLMHKACGWMLRECGKRDAGVLRGFLGAHAPRMPRTMLRYAIEKLPAAERRSWLGRD